MYYDNILSIMESILFISSEKISIKELLSILNDNEINISKSDLVDALELLNKKYMSNNSGLMLLKIENSYRLVANPKNNKYIEYVTIKKKKKTLSQAALEVVSIIAYKQPITKIEIEEIRGVNSDAVVNNLLEMRVIEEKGRLDRIGRPILYGTTDVFLQEFGIKSIKELPKIDEVLTKEEVIDEQ